MWRKIHTLFTLKQSVIMNALTLWTETHTFIHEWCCTTNVRLLYAARPISMQINEEALGAVRTQDNKKTQLSMWKGLKKIFLQLFYLHSPCYKLRKRCHWKIKCINQQMCYTSLTKPQGLLKGTTWKLEKGSRSEKWYTSSSAVKGRIQILGSGALWKGDMWLISYPQ